MTGEPGSRLPDRRRRALSTRMLGAGTAMLMLRHPALAAAPKPDPSAGQDLAAARAATDAPGIAAAGDALLDPAQSAAFRAWFVAIVEDQVLRGPAAQWQHRDCAGLVRFAVGQALRDHDERWMQAIGWDRRRPRPPALDIDADRLARLREWTLVDGRTSAYASAIALVQHNCRFIDKTRTRALPGDLLFFDQGDDQHLMVWTGRRVAYHTGAEPVAAPAGRAAPADKGLRHVRWEQLLAHPDTRWRPSPDNPNFAGLFRLAFLSDRS